MHTRKGYRRRRKCGENPREYKFEVVMKRNDSEAIDEICCMDISMWNKMTNRRNGFTGLFDCAFSIQNVLYLMNTI